MGVLPLCDRDHKFLQHPDLVIINHDKDPVELKVISSSLIKGHY